MLDSVMKTVAIVPAGGKGRRFLTTGRKKQFLELAGVPIIIHTLWALQSADVIDSMVLVVPEEDRDWFGKEIPRYGVDKVKVIVPGGEHRQDSVWAGILATDEDADILLVHDGVRPLVEERLIENTVRAAREYGAALAALSVTDTVKLCNPDGWVINTLPRDNIFLAQTPQAFRRDIIVSAFEAAYRERFYGTDESSLVERLGWPVHIVPGSHLNIKITWPEDLTLAQFLMRRT
ncbi:MAG: 2-C-methyl-D-erythritol 4-phosphate cytidylyltransferase [Syntrophales bacterium]|nr:2-C-methyl-D-erythritol 4-phosphate cytidylyltransferase [Syntrophales bacterium]